MLRLIYLLRNLTRNPLRTALTGVAVALPITIFVLSAAVIDGIDRFLDNAAKQLRLAVTHKASIVNPLPAGYRRKIESLDPSRKRILSVIGTRYIGGRAVGDPRPMGTLAADHDTYLATFPENKLNEEEAAAWLRDRQAIVLGSATAAQFGWSVGQRISIQNTFPPYTVMEFHVVAISRNTADTITNICRRDYWEEELQKWMPGDELLSFLFVKCATAEDLAYFRSAIDAMFANTPDETKTQDEKSFMNEFITQQFNLPRNLSILAAVTIFVAVMAAMNTMSMNFRDRIHEFATLKSMGFGTRLVFTLIQSESVLLCTVGGALGAMIPYVAFTHTPLADITVPLIMHLTIEPRVCGISIAISLCIGVAAALWPAWLAARMKAVVALRDLG